MAAILTFFEPFVYPEIVVAILVMTEFIKRYFHLRVHAKWQTFWVAVIVLFLELVFRWGEVDLWKAIISFGIATLSYDYVITTIRERFWPTKSR